MILKAIFDLITKVIDLIPFSLPACPERVQSIIDYIFEGLDSGFPILGLFIDLPFWFSCAAAMTVIFNIKKIWNMFIFLLNLIPGVSISYWQ